ncbi:efflux RND transporter periplasmic adaptor subunit [Massilia arenae]|uniref:Efflux RND transporter periplasmic adaptor subunit n=1 Tax=Massilia arenae TaxID=2603288 RepID=A0A5C7FPJ9_9BURK|nr:efflux RND transporter periplasmic adaptor subunit [Massilia arenae]TXF96122.1 efflux RND transporter periplasmic adaptor subunit [Massilia arenae]
MDQIPPPAVTGAAMDVTLPPRRGRRAAQLALAFVAIAVCGALLWQMLPRGLEVELRDVRIASVEAGVFRDEIVVRALAEPLNSIMLDAVESGRVEEVFARDGQVVKKGDLLFRLSNPQRNLDLLARQAEHAQQISNLANLQVAQEAVRTDHQRRLNDLEFAFAQVEKQHARNARLARDGFISAVALEESGDKLAQARRALDEESRGMRLEQGVRERALKQMDQAIRGLASGLELVAATVDALAVRAPSDGVLTDFRLLVGQAVRQDQAIGRIDDPNRFKLSAQVDEFYLSRVNPGRPGRIAQDGKAYALRVNTVYPQVREGRFSAELVFTGRQPDVISPGQSMDVQLTLGQSARALLLPNGAFANDGGGAWVFALAADGSHAERRDVKLGRRNNTQVEVLHGLAAGDKVIVSGYAGFGEARRLRLTD